MSEYHVTMHTWYSLIGFGESDDDYIGMEDGEQQHRVGSLLLLRPNKPGGFMIVTATHTGYVEVTARFSDAPRPPAEELSDWEDMAIAQIESPAGDLVAQEGPAGSETTPNLIPRPGAYGVRVLARGRDLPQPEDLSDTAPDRYLVDLWPAPPAGVSPESITTSSIGQEIELT